jgi:hypothetical protein
MKTATTTAMVMIMMRFLFKLSSRSRIYTSRFEFFSLCNTTDWDVKIEENGIYKEVSLITSGSKM